MAQREATQISGAVLGNDAILKEIEKGTIIVSPFTPEYVQTTSIDVRLGKYYYRQEAPEIPPLYKTNISKNQEVCVYPGNKMWSQIPSSAKRFKYALKELNVTQKHTNLFLLSAGNLNDSSNDKFIILNPGESILAHTEEFIGSTPESGITTMCETKSTLGRLLTNMHMAGWGDKGYFNRWTLEITNNGENAVLLQRGQVVAQIVFLRVEGCNPETTYTTKGRYQSGNDIETLKKTWVPTMMLPKI